MSGTISELQRHIKPLFADLDHELEAAVMLLIQVILSNQYVKLPECDRHYWRVLVGSGMGLSISDKIASSVFICLPRKHFCSDRKCG